MIAIRLVIVACLLLAASLPAQGVAVDGNRLDDPRKEAMARAIMKDIRCLVCQNQSIEDSNADLAKDLRRIVRERVAAGDSPGEVRDFLVARYGDWVLMRPPVDPRTYLLWGAPALLFALGAGAALMTVRRRRAHAAGLSAEEEARVQSLFKEVDTQ